MNRNESILSTHRDQAKRLLSHGVTDYGQLMEGWSRRRFIKAAALAAFVAPVLKSTAATPARIVGLPYLQSMTENSVIICWRTDAGMSPLVSYGIDPLNPNLSATGTTATLGANYMWHMVRITGLTPQTLYSYKISHLNAGDVTPVESSVYRFRTLPAKGTRSKNILRFLIVGDNQLKSVTRYETILGRAKAKIESMYGMPIEQAIDTMIQVGDQVDNGDLDQYRYVHLEKCAEVSRSLAFHTIIGNHETYGTPGLTLYDAHFDYSGLVYGGLPSPDPTRYYANQVGTVLFLHLNSENTGGAQETWVRSVFAKAKDDTTVDFIVSLCHRPYQAEQYVGDISSWMRNTILPLLSSSPKHVLTIGAHHHLYARGQARDYPTYHIISGGTAWDQYWGQSTESDYDDVTKTLCHWCWQILEFDLDAKRMSVANYAEGNVKCATQFCYDSKLVDSFHRQLTLAAPNKPVITNVQSASVTLPLTINSGAFSSVEATESLFSIQYQISPDSAFSTKVVDRIVDVENYYGDTGSPNFAPIDKNAGIDIRKYVLAANSLTNSTYYARIRHRDTNASWSAWSDSYSFTVTGSSLVSTPALTLGNKVYSPSSVISATFANAPGNLTDKIAIFAKSQATPAAGAEKAWKYLNNTTTAPTAPVKAGTVSLSNNAAFVAGTEWYAVMLSNGTYTQATAKMPFYVGSTPTINVGKAAYNTGESVTITYANATAGAKNWIGIYKAGDTPGTGAGTVASTKYQYATAASGTLAFTALADAFYYAVFFVNDGYFEASTRVAFSVGTAPAVVGLGASVFAYGNPVVVSFSGGAGTAKDWMGVYAKGAVPGTDVLINYTYVDGRTAGNVTINQTLPAGEYYTALFINDSYTAISNSTPFTVTGGPIRPEIGVVTTGSVANTLEITLYPKPGSTHRLWNSTDMINWTLVDTFAGLGLQMVKVVSWSDGTPVGFWKVDTL